MYFWNVKGWNWVKRIGLFQFSQSNFKSCTQTILTSGRFSTRGILDHGSDQEGLKRFYHLHLIAKLFKFAKRGMGGSKPWIKEGIKMTLQVWKIQIRREVNCGYVFHMSVSYFERDISMVDYSISYSSLLKNSWKLEIAQEWS